MQVRLSRIVRGSVAVILAALALTMAVALGRDPGPFSIHYGRDGRPNGWVGRDGLALLELAITALLAAVIAAIGAIARRPGTSADEARALGIVQLLIALHIVRSALQILHPALAALPHLPTAPVLMSLTLAVLGATLGRVRQNRIVGVRTPWSRASRLAWDRANRLTGRLFLALGLAGLSAAGFVPAGRLMPVLTIGVVAAAGAAAWESWRAWRGDPDRTPV